MFIINGCLQFEKALILRFYRNAAFRKKKGIRKKKRKKKERMTRNHLKPPADFWLQRVERIK